MERAGCMKDSQLWYLPVLLVIHRAQATPSSVSKGDKVQMNCDVNAAWLAQVWLTSYKLTCRLHGLTDSLFEMFLRFAHYKKHSKYKTCWKFDFDASMRIGRSVSTQHMPTIPSPITARLFLDFGFRWQKPRVWGSSALRWRDLWAETSARVLSYPRRDLIRMGASSVRRFWNVLKHLDTSDMYMICNYVTCMPIVRDSDSEACSLPDNWI